MNGSGGLSSIDQSSPPSPPQQIQLPTTLLIPVLEPPQQETQARLFLRTLPPRNLILPPDHERRLKMFWENELRCIQESETVRLNALPLARIRKVVKSEESVNKIASEVPMLFSKACELFICELTLRAWMHTEDEYRRNLRRSDLSSALTRTDVYDFLIDIVPRDRDLEFQDYLSAPENNNDNIYGGYGGNIVMDGYNEMEEPDDDLYNGVTIAFPGTGITTVVDGYDEIEELNDDLYNGVTIAFPSTDMTTVVDGYDEMEESDYDLYNGVTIAFPGPSITEMMYRYPYEIPSEQLGWNMGTYVPDYEPYLYSTMQTGSREEDNMNN